MEFGSVILLKIILLLFLFLSSAFFSGSETVLFSLSAIQLQKFKESRKKSLRNLTKLLKEPRKILATILLGNEFSNVAISIVIASLVYDCAGELGFEISSLISIAVTTILILIFGEIVPKNIAIRSATVLAPIVVVPLKQFYRIVNPARSILSSLADVIIRLFGGDPAKQQSMVLEEEFRYLVDLAHKSGEMEEEEREMIHKVFDFGDKVVGDIMTEANSIFSLESGTKYDDLLVNLKATQYSRVPIYKDKKDNIIGILYLKDLFRYHKKASSVTNSSIADILRPTLFVGMQDKLEHLLDKFRSEKIHMAIVMDGNKKIIGLVTMDDVLEELFGEMEV